jgi:hypothetical protein
MSVIWIQLKIFKKWDRAPVCKGTLIAFDGLRISKILSDFICFNAAFIAFRTCLETDLKIRTLNLILRKAIILQITLIFTSIS